MKKKLAKRLLLIDMCLKALLVVFFIIALTANLPQLAGKGMTERAPLYLGSIFVIPVVSYFRKTKKYPYLADILFVMPFLTDTFGNLLGLYESIWFYDDLLHAINWTFLVLAIELFFDIRSDSKIKDVVVGTAIGSLIIVIWEIMEWAISVDGFGISNNLHLTYTDTIGDLFTSTVGGAIGAVIGVKYLNNSTN